MFYNYKYILDHDVKNTIDIIDNAVNHFITVDAGLPSLQHLFYQPS